MMGLTPCLRAALNSSTEPFITPWSVSPIAGWPSSAARAARASTLHAPSSSEYSEWTCRWAQAGVLTDRQNRSRRLGRPGPPRPRRFRTLRGAFRAAICGGASTEARSCAAAPRRASRRPPSRWPWARRRAAEPPRAVARPPRRARPAKGREVQSVCERRHRWPTTCGASVQRSASGPVDRAGGPAGGRRASPPASFCGGRRAVAEHRLELLVAALRGLGPAQRGGQRLLAAGGLARGFVSAAIGIGG